FQAIETALEVVVAQQWRTLVIRDRINSTAGQFACQKRGKARGDGLAGPHVKVIAEDAGVAQVNLAVPAQTGTPVARHLGDSFRGARQGAAEGIFHAAVDHALGGNRLITAQGPGLKQRKMIACVPEPISQPQARDTPADDGDIKLDWDGGDRHGDSLFSRCKCARSIKLFAVAGGVTCRGGNLWHTAAKVTGPVWRADVLHRWRHDDIQAVDGVAVCGAAALAGLLPFPTPGPADPCESSPHSIHRQNRFFYSRRTGILLAWHHDPDRLHRPLPGAGDG